MTIEVKTEKAPDTKPVITEDSVIAKLIVHGSDREEAISRMSRALDEFVIEGIKTTIPFHKRVLKSPQFLAGKYSTNLVDQLLNP